MRMTWMAMALAAGWAACGDGDTKREVDSGGDTAETTTTTDTTTSETTATDTTTETIAETVEDTAQETVAETVDDTGGETSSDTADETSDVPDPGPLDPMYTLVILEPLVIDEASKVFSAPLGIDAQGVITGYAAVEAWGPDARAISVTSAGVVTVLPVAEVQSGYAYASSGGALVVGTNRFQPTAWVGGVEATMKVPDGWFSGSAQGVNTSGLVVGSWADSDDALPPNPVGPRPCTWATATAAAAPLATIEGADPLGIAFDVNDDGVIAGTLATVASGFLAVRWADADAEPVVVTLAGATLAEAKAINARGDVAGRATLADNTSRAFRALAGEDGILLPPLVAAEPYAEGFDLDDTGRVVGASRFSEGVLHGTIWGEDGLAIDVHDRLSEALPEGALRISSAVAITPDGKTIACEVVMDEGFGDSVRRIGILRAVEE